MAHSLRVSAVLLVGLGEVASRRAFLQPHLSLHRCELRQGHSACLSLCLPGRDSGGRWAREAGAGGEQGPRKGWQACLEVDMPSALGEMGEKAGWALWMCLEQWNVGGT